VVVLSAGIGTSIRVLICTASRVVPSAAPALAQEALKSSPPAFSISVAFEKAVPPPSIYRGPSDGVGVLLGVIRGFIDCVADTSTVGCDDCDGIAVADEVRVPVPVLVGSRVLVTEMEGVTEIEAETDGDTVTDTLSDGETVTELVTEVVGETVGETDVVTVIEAVTEVEADTDEETLLLIVVEGETLLLTDLVGETLFDTDIDGEGVVEGETGMQGGKALVKEPAPVPD
jgi:hypothetical protein